MRPDEEELRCARVRGARLREEAYGKEEEDGALEPGDQSENARDRCGVVTCVWQPNRVLLWQPGGHPEW